MPTTPIDTQHGLTSLADSVARAFAGTVLPHIVGIHTGGCWVAHYLADALDISAHQVGQLDVGFHRDDFARRGMRKAPLPTLMPNDISNQQVLLVDDVLHTGRTVRAAINALFDYGRPSRIWLAVLADRGDRQLPYHADFVGLSVQAELDQQLRLTGPAPLKLVLQARDSSKKAKP
ncbi:MAG: bifunctional pyr operon transcriptional regulator/uracil phosphoribosyltransferase PyrR [Lysobacterales bacterium]